MKKRERMKSEGTVYINNHQFDEDCFNTSGYNFTKIRDAKLIVNGKEIPLEKTTTWASLLRSVNNATKPYRQYEGCQNEFNKCIKETVDFYRLAMNHNFSMELFEDDSWMNSSVYLNNQNHALEVFDGKKICAVYSGEVVVVLIALITCCNKEDAVELSVIYDRKNTMLGQFGQLRKFEESEATIRTCIGMAEGRSAEEFKRDIEESINSIMELVADLNFESRRLCKMYSAFQLMDRSDVEE